MASAKQKKKTCNFVERFLNTEPKLSNLLPKGGKTEDFTQLSMKDKEEIWSVCLCILKDRIHNIKSGIEENDVLVVNELMEFFLHIFNHNIDIVDSSVEFLKIVHYLNTEDLTLLDGNVKNSISKVCAFWIITKETPMNEGLEYFLLGHLMQLCLSEKPLVSDLQRLSGIRKHCTIKSFEWKIPSLKPLLKKLVQSNFVVNSDHGQRFLAQIWTLSSKLMNDLHRIVIIELKTCTKRKASSYGKIYALAWYCATDDNRSDLEKNGFQDLMEKFLNEHRKSLELSKNAQNILCMLEVWHKERKKKQPVFIRMITDAYQPILWKYLQSGFNVWRCNAADVFFKAFPLQRPGDSVLKNEKLFSLQFDQMITLLRDDCHIVRIIAIREICNIFAHYWNSFAPSQIQQVLTVMTKECARDASTAEVRRMVYVGLHSLTKNPLSLQYLVQILPGMCEHLHDVNQRVRIAFLQLLIGVRNASEETFKLSDFVPTAELFSRLAVDNTSVGGWIMQLLLPYYFVPEMTVSEWTKRFIMIIKKYPRSYRNFFLFSAKVLPLEQSLHIMCEILTQVGVFVINKLSSNNENEEQPEVQVTKRRRTKRAPLSEQNGGRKGDAEEVRPKECAFEDSTVVTGLLDIVAILWVLHDNSLNKPEHEEEKMRLLETYVKYAQPLIVYYKDSKVFLTVLSLSSNIPVSILRSNSITLPGYCIKMLKKLKMEACSESNENLTSMLMALVKWGRGGDILEQVQLWLEAAFDTQNLDTTILAKKRVKIRESVPNSVVAILVLDILLKADFVQTSILRKNYHQLLNLWNIMSKVVLLIETRLDNGEPFSEDLVSDEFLALCFRRYVKLIPLLRTGGEKKPESRADAEMQMDAADAEEGEETEKKGGFNPQEKMTALLTWADEHVCPLLQHEPDPEDVALMCSVMNNLTYAADNLVIVNLVKPEFYFKLGHLVLKLLTTRYGLRFIHAASRYAVVLSQVSKQLMHVADDMKLFTVVVPSIVSQMFKVMVARRYTDEELAPYHEDLGAIKGHLKKMLACYQDNFQSKEKSMDGLHQLRVMVNIVLEAILSIVTLEIPREDLSIPMYANPSELPLLAATFFQLFSSSPKFWAPMFLHVLNTRLTADEMNSKTLVACLLVLNLFAESSLSNHPELNNALSIVTRKLEKLRVVNQQKLSYDKILEEVDSGIKKSWPTGKSVRDSEQGVSTDKEAWSSNAATMGDNVTGTDLTDDFVACGFGLIKKITHRLTTGPDPEEDSS